MSVDVILLLLSLFIYLSFYIYKPERTFVGIMATFSFKYEFTYHNISQYYNYFHIAMTNTFHFLTTSFQALVPYCFRMTYLLSKKGAQLTQILQIIVWLLQHDFFTRFIANLHLTCSRESYSFKALENLCILFKGFANLFVTHAYVPQLTTNSP